MAYYLKSNIMMRHCQTISVSSVFFTLAKANKYLLYISYIFFSKIEIGLVPYMTVNHQGGLQTQILPDLLVFHLVSIGMVATQFAAYSVADMLVSSKYVYVIYHWF